jgi:hypothetical protein
MPKTIRKDISDFDGPVWRLCDLTHVLAQCVENTFDNNSVGISEHDRSSLLRLALDAQRLAHTVKDDYCNG